MESDYALYPNNDPAVDGQRCECTHKRSAHPQDNTPQSGHCLGGLQDASVTIGVGLCCCKVFIRKDDNLIRYEQFWLSCVYDMKGYVACCKCPDTGIPMKALDPSENTYCNTHGFELWNKHYEKTQASTESLSEV